MKLKLLILLTLASLGVSAQSWVNFGANGIQRKVNGTDTAFRWNGGASGYLYGRSEYWYQNNLGSALTFSNGLQKTGTNVGLGGNASWTGNLQLTGNQTIIGNLYMPFNRWIGYDNLSPLAPIHVGNRNVLNSSNAQILVAGTYDNSFPTSGHAFSDGTLITGVGSSKAYAGYDGRVDIQGTGVNMDHYVSFQHGPNLNFAGTLNDNFGLYTTSLLQAGTLTNNYGVYIANPVKTGGVMTNNYGIYIANQTAGSGTNYSIFSAGGYNRFDGEMEINAALYLNAVGGNLRLKADGTNALDAGLYVNAIGDTYLANWDQTHGFASLGNGIGYYFGGNFGVKTMTPSEDFEVAGSALVSGTTNQPNSVVRKIDLDNAASSGNYTPTITNVANTSAITNIGTAHYTRVGNKVTVTGAFSLSVTSATTASGVTISLPVASNLANLYDLLGLGQSVGGTQNGITITGETTSNVADLYFMSSSVIGSGQTIIYTFTYEII